MKEIRLDVFPGDGIGKETVAAGKKVLDAVADAHGGFLFRYEQFDWSCEYFAKHGRMMPEKRMMLEAGFPLNISMVPKGDSNPHGFPHHP